MPNIRSLSLSHYITATHLTTISNVSCVFLKKKMRDVFCLLVTADMFAYLSSNSRITQLSNT